MFDLNLKSNFNLKHSFLSGLAEVEVVKKPFTKLFDAYGCLGVLLVNSGQEN